MYPALRICNLCLRGGYNQPLDNWEVGNVENMNSMFEGNKFFNQNIKNWDVEKVKKAKQYDKFAENGALECKYNPFCDNNKKYKPASLHDLGVLVMNPDISLADIDVSLMTSLTNIFSYSTRKDFTGIEDWDVSNVTDMNNLFSYCSTFNQPLDRWNTSKMYSMNYMFMGASSFDQNISMWDVSGENGHYDFAKDCPINNTYKMPKFKP